MSDKITKVCDNPACNAEKKIGNNWYRITSMPKLLTIEPITGEYYYCQNCSIAVVPKQGGICPECHKLLAPKGEVAVYDACGESCVAAIVSKVLGVRKVKV